MSNDIDTNNNSSSMARIFRQQKLDYEGMNTKLFKNIEILEQENVPSSSNPILSSYSPN